MPVMAGVERALCQSPPWRQLQRRVILPWVMGSIELRGTALEIGGGAGSMAELLLERYPQIMLSVTDYDPHMVARAQNRLRSHGDRVRVHQADATALEDDDDSFDAVCSFIMLHHVGDWRAAIREVARVLRPGGVFVGFDLTDTRVARLSHRLWRSEIGSMVLTSTLRSFLGEAGLTTSAVTAGIGGSVVRFTAYKPPRTRARE